MRFERGLWILRFDKFSESSRLYFGAKLRTESLIIFVHEQAVLVPNYRTIKRINLTPNSNGTFSKSYAFEYIFLNLTDSNTLWMTVEFRCPYRDGSENRKNQPQKRFRNTKDDDSKIFREFFTEIIFHPVPLENVSFIRVKWAFQRIFSYFFHHHNSRY